MIYRKPFSRLIVEQSVWIANIDKIAVLPLLLMHNRKTRLINPIKYSNKEYMNIY